MTPTTMFEGFAPQAFIFDFDGTIGDSMGAWVEVDRLFLERHGLPQDDEYNEIISALGFEAGSAWVVEHFDIGMTAEEVVEEWIDFSRYFYEHTVELKPHAKAYLKTVRAAGFPMAIATSLKRELLELALKRHGILDYFDTLCICDELSSSGKLEPTVYLEAASRLGAMRGRPLALSDCVVFEDIALAANTARKAGAYVVGLFDDSSIAERDELCAACNRVIGSFGELLHP